MTDKNVTPQSNIKNHHHSYEQGATLIKDYADSLPEKPGVYRMIGVDDKVLYVGKAKNLKSRVISYTRLTNLNNRIMRMVSMTQAMIFERTASESEALLLEADLIKTLKPHFNVLLRDDKSYPYILCRLDHPAPQILKHRGKKTTKGTYWGPFASGSNVARILEILQKVFLLRTCTDNVYAHRSRPCILYQIKRCSAPCTGEISVDDYQKSIKQASEFMSGGSKKIIQSLSNDMYTASQNMDYEKAGDYRDRLKAISQIGLSADFNPTTFTEADIFALFRKDGMVCIQANFMRAGQNWGGNSYFPRFQDDMTNPDIMDGFLGQFYQNKPPAKLILLSDSIEHTDILTQALHKRYDIKTTIETPQKGKKFDAINRIMMTAEQELNRKLLNTGTQTELMQNLAEILGIPDTLKRIEVYDNAHTQGAFPIGAMIVATADGFAKKEYRTWKIHNPHTKTNDDYGMMREVFERRFKRLNEEALENPDSVPDLIILDGGQGQLSTVLEVAKEYDITIPIVAVAKGQDRNAGRERFFMADKESFLLPPNDKTLFYVQRLRDEAHRHANGTHAKKRDKPTESNELDSITGIGAGRKKALIAHFGSSRAVREATFEQLEKTPMISKAIALKVYNHFNDVG
jgi:excinuclease ABC subunit C